MHHGFLFMFTQDSVLSFSRPFIYFRSLGSKQNVSCTGFLLRLCICVCSATCLYMCVCVCVDVSKTKERKKRTQRINHVHYPNEVNDDAYPYQRLERRVSDIRWEKRQAVRSRLRSYGEWNEPSV